MVFAVPDGDFRTAARRSLFATPAIEAGELTSSDLDQRAVLHLGRSPHWDAGALTAGYNAPWALAPAMRARLTRVPARKADRISAWRLPARTTCGRCVVDQTTLEHPAVAENAPRKSGLADTADRTTRPASGQGAHMHHPAVLDHAAPLCAGLLTYRTARSAAVCKMMRTARCRTSRLEGRAPSPRFIGLATARKRAFDALFPADV
jgi:hypothetical protein